MRVDLNSDLGESFGPWKMGDDEAMLGIITSAGVACGWHAGDPNVMHRAAELAKRHGGAIGAHPSFNDLWGLGRRVIRGASMAELARQLRGRPRLVSSLSHTTPPRLEQQLRATLAHVCAWGQIP